MSLFLLGVLAFFNIEILANAKGYDDTGLSSCELSIGVSNWLPYQSISDSGVAAGKQVKLVKQIAKVAGCKLNFKRVKFVDGLAEMKAGKTDMQMNASHSFEREKYSYFSIPYRKEFLLLYSTPKYAEICQTASLEELIRKGFKLGLQYHLVYGPELTKIQKDPELNSKIIYTNNNVQHVELVEENNLDGVVDDPVVVSYRSALDGTGKALQSCPIVVSSSPISLIFSKKSVSPEVVKRFNQAIKTVQNTQKYQRDWSW
ncbi:MAG: transporter substrate-binding domain-containing protein [Kangiellaceae bacterium]|nr:transporter substrate-binding domain-containing protein [Kangiellaceae bacterium]MCW8997439.1 transporter substrate-binding domain-containing protein [Kangiellaceae bacterium]MCW9018577.1 transporter substrate-binding domain-containing protein [Kangiellaceae bacterium]